MPIIKQKNTSLPKASCARRYHRRVLSALLALALLPLATTPAATLNPSASKAYVDKQIEAIRAVLAGEIVFTNTLQVVTNTYYNTYTNTYVTNVHSSVYNITTNSFHIETNVNSYVTYKTNTTVNVYNTTNITNDVHNVYTNTFVTNFTTEVTTNLTVWVTTNVYDVTTNLFVTNITTEVTTNLDVWVTNVVNIVTNTPVFPNPVSYTNSAQSIFGYTGIVITVSEWDSNDYPAAYATNAVVFAPRADMANTYTNATHTLSLMYWYSPLTSRNDFWYAAYSNSVSQYSLSPMELSSNFDDPSINLNLRTSYDGDSWATASSMTLLYTTMMFTDYALILQRAQVASKEVNSRVVEYNETIAAGYSDEARRLVSDGGLQWLDPTGVWWEVSSVYPVKSYRVLGQTLFQVPTDEQVVANQDAKFANANESLIIRHGLTGDGSGYYSTWNLFSSDPYLDITTEEYRYENQGLSQQVSFYDNVSAESYIAYACTAYTNGVVGTNAVRRVLFDDLSGGTGNALSRFDGMSISTNAEVELQIRGFSEAVNFEVPFKSAGEVKWGDVNALVSGKQTTDATWAFFAGRLYNCYVQVGREVYSAGTNNTAVIEKVNTLPDGAYGVGVHYVYQGNVEFHFGLMDTIPSKYETVLYVGTLGSGPYGKTWNGIHSIPLVLIFE